MINVDFDALAVRQIPSTDRVAVDVKFQLSDPLSELDGPTTYRARVRKVIRPDGSVVKDPAGLGFLVELTQGGNQAGTGSVYVSVSGPLPLATLYHPSTVFVVGLVEEGVRWLAQVPISGACSLQTLDREARMRAYGSYTQLEATLATTDETSIVSILDSAGWRTYLVDVVVSVGPSPVRFNICYVAAPGTLHGSWVIPANSTVTIDLNEIATCAESDALGLQGGALFTAQVIGSVPEGGVAVSGVVSSYAYLDLT